MIFLLNDLIYSTKNMKKKLNKLFKIKFQTLIMVLTNLRYSNCSICGRRGDSVGATNLMVVKNI